MNWLHRQVCRSARWRHRIKRLVPWALQGVDLGDDVLEVGPGPGVTTDLLRGLIRRLTALEVDAAAASALQQRLDGSGVRVTATVRICHPQTARSQGSRRSRSCTTSQPWCCRTACWRRRGGCCVQAASSPASTMSDPSPSGLSISATPTIRSIRTRSGRGCPNHIGTARSFDGRSTKPSFLQV